MGSHQKFLEAMYTMLFIELFVHDQYVAGDAEQCREKALYGAQAATEYFLERSEPRKLETKDDG